MGLSDRNRYLQILHRICDNREMIDKVMKDIDLEGIFEEENIEDNYDEVEEISEILFNPNLSKKEKKEAIVLIKDSKNIENDKSSITIVNEEREKLILAKQKEYIELGIVPADDIEYISSEKDGKVSRYGRSPLHEAIAHRDIKFVRKCIKRKMFLKDKDNNGNTPREMAYYEGWTEVLELFNEEDV